MDRKYSWQLARLAPTLVGSTLQETISNFHKFEIDHIQYKLGGATQYIHSPACTWASRKEGVDCKSFSVFSSALLSSVGIKHYIRQIKQPNFDPENFTHVHVVIPIDQSIQEYDRTAATWVLDGTKIDNIESIKTDFEDIPMMLEHIGLNAPAADAKAQEIANHFNKFCQALLYKGVSVDIVNAIRAEVSKYTSRGISPKIKISKTSMTVEGKVFPFNLPYGLQADTSGTGTDTGTGGDGAGEDWDDIAAIFEDIEWDQIFDFENFGTCSSTREQSAQTTRKDAEAIMQISGLSSGVINIASLNKFMEMSEAYIQRRKRVARMTSGCNRDSQTTAHGLMVDFQEQIFSQVATQLQQQGWQVREADQKSKDEIQNINLPLTNGGWNGGGSTVIKPSVLDPYTYAVFEFVDPYGNVVSTVSANVETPDTSTPTANDPSSPDTPNIPGNPTPAPHVPGGQNQGSSGTKFFTTKKVLTATALGAGIFFFPKIVDAFQGDISPKSPKTKK